MANTRTLALIEEHAGKLHTPDIARLAGVTPGRIRCVASDNGISLAMPHVARPDQRLYNVFVKPEDQAHIAECVNTVIQAKGLVALQDAFLLAIEALADQVRAG